MQIVAVKVEDVETRYVLENKLHEAYVMGQCLPAVLVAPECPRAGCDQFGRGFRIAAGEERDLVPESHEFLGQVRNDSFRAAVLLRRHAFIEGSDLCDSHHGFSLLLVVDPHLRQTLAALLEVANLHQCRPQLDRTLDDAHDIIHDPQQVLLEEVGFEAVERLVQVCRKHPQRIGPLRAK